MSPFWALLKYEWVPEVAQQMPFWVVGRIAGESEYPVLAVCRRYVHMAGGLAGYSKVSSVPFEETSLAQVLSPTEN